MEWWTVLGWILWAGLGGGGDVRGSAGYDGQAFSCFGTRARCWPMLGGCVYLRSEGGDGLLVLWREVAVLVCWNLL